MLLKGKIRGNGRQLADYLLAQNTNEYVRILDVDGQSEFTEQEFKNLLRDMSLNEQLTRSRKGIYHASINPSPEDSQRMSDADWIIAADILAEELGFANQRRGIVLHQKHKRLHAHIAFERYDIETNKMLAIDFNYYKQDKARSRMEEVFNHKPTPRRNPKRPAMKETLTDIWKRTNDAASFMKQAQQQGYIISKGFERIPYMIVDDTGRSYNLVRHLDGIKTKEVRERLGTKVLTSEKDAIAFARTQQEVTHSAIPQKEDPQERPGTEQVSQFAENLAAMRQRQQQRKHKPRMG